MTDARLHAGEYVIAATAASANQSLLNEINPTANYPRGAVMTEPKFVTVYHPTIAGVSEEIRASKVSEYTDAGWRKSPLPESDDK